MAAISSVILWQAAISIDSQSFSFIAFVILEFLNFLVLVCKLLVLILSNLITIATILCQISQVILWQTVTSIYLQSFSSIAFVVLELLIFSVLVCKLLVCNFDKLWVSITREQLIFRTWFLQQFSLFLNALPLPIIRFENFRLFFLLTRKLTDVSSSHYGRGQNCHPRFFLSFPPKECI